MIWKYFGFNVCGPRENDVCFTIGHSLMKNVEWRKFVGFQIQNASKIGSINEISLRITSNQGRAGPARIQFQSGPGRAGPKYFGLRAGPGRADLEFFCLRAGPGRAGPHSQQGRAGPGRKKSARFSSLLCTTHRLIFTQE